MTERPTDYRCGRAPLLLLFLLLLLPSPAPAQSGVSNEMTPRHFASAPFQFVENIGQFSQAVLMQGVAGDATVRFDSSGVDYLYAVTRRNHEGEEIAGTRRHLLRTTFLDADPNVSINGEERSETVYNYYLGSDSKQWYAGARGYKRVRYTSIYPGIDALYYGSGDRMKYDFIVAPGADHRRIALRYEGASSLRVNDSGYLEIGTPFGTVREAPPYSYQQIGSRRVRVQARYRLLDDGAYGFVLGSYNPRYPVVIDPCLSVEYATYFGGGGYDVVTAMAVDSSGFAYAAGFTRAPDFPIVPGGGILDQQNYTFVSKLSADGTRLIYSTVLSPAYDGPYAVTSDAQQKFESIGEDIEVTSTGDAFVAMTTNASALPTTAGVFRRTKPANRAANPCDVEDLPNFDVYVVRLNGSGTLTWGTYLGGGSNDYLSDIALAPSGSLSITGLTYAPTCTVAGRTVSDSIDFPVTVGQGSFNSSDSLKGFETFVSTLSGDGRTLEFSILYGGTGDELAGRIAVTSSNTLIFIGATNSTDLLTTENAYRRTSPGIGGDVYDLYITEINPGTTALSYSSYLSDAGASRRGIGIGALSRRANPNQPLSGFDRNDRQLGLLLDRTDGVIAIGGSTRSTSLPTTAGAISTSLHNPDGGMASTDAYVLRMNIRTNQVLAATYLGGGDFDGFGGMAWDSFGDIAVALLTESSDIPRTAVAVQPAIAGNSDAAIIVISPNARSVSYGSYMGGNPGSYDVEHRVYGITTASDGAMYLFGGTGSPDFPVTPGALNKVNDYFGGFIVKFAAPGPPQIGSGARIEFDLSLCDSVEFVKHTIFNAGQQPAKIESINFLRGQNFYIVNPPVFPYTLGACEQLAITVAFRPGEVACNKRVFDTLVVNASNAVNKQILVPVRGTKVCLSFSILNPTIVDSNHRLGSRTTYRFPITTQGDATQYVTLRPDPGSGKYFWPEQGLDNTPFGPGTAFIPLASFPPDTGYYCESWTVTIQPCNRVRKLNICIYVRSGIYTGPDSVDLGLTSCREITYTFVVRNTGNDSLHMRMLYGGGPDGVDVPLDSAMTTERAIAAGDSTVYTARFLPKGYGKRNPLLIFETDDLRRKGVVIFARYELDSTAIQLSTTSLMGAFGETLTLPVQYQSLLEGRVPTTEISFLTRFDPAMLDLSSVDSKGTLTEGWQIVEKQVVRGRGTFVWLRAGATGAPLAAAGTLANLKLSVLRGNAVDGPLGIELAGVSKGCINALIDTGQTFALSPECRDQDRLLFFDRSMLRPSVPNPAREDVSIPYHVPTAGHVTLVLYDITGREVLRLIDGMRDAGEGEVRFQTGTLPAGRYFYRMQNDGYTSETREMVIER